MHTHKCEALPLSIAFLALLVAFSSPAYSQHQQASFNVGGGGAPKTPSSGGGAGADAGSSFDQFIAQNVEHYAVTEQIYASKAKNGTGGKTLDADLSAAEASKVRYVVSPDGKGKFRTITEAIKAVPEKNKQRVILDIRPGTYK
jgi:pectinesterase